MANTDKDILITPGKDTSNIPSISFVGFDNDPITLNVLDDNTISFEGSEGQLFSVTNNLTSGTIFQVADDNGVPGIAMDADGTVDLIPYNGMVAINAGGQFKFTDNTARPRLVVSRPSQKTQYDIEGNIRGGITDGNYGGLTFTQQSDGAVPLASMRIEYKSTGYPDIGFYTRSGANAETRRMLIQGNSNRVGINTSDFSYTSSDNSSVFTSGGNAGITNNVLYVSGSIQLLGNTDGIVFGRGTSTFLKDEELAFGWGGGWYMQDGTYLRVRGSKTLYNNSWIRTDSGIRFYGNGTTSTGYSYDCSSNEGKYFRQGNSGWQMYGAALARSMYITGRLDTYYPVRFISTTWPGNATASRLRIMRPTVHTNGSWYGSFSWEYKYHPSNWGHWGRNSHHVEYFTGTGRYVGDPLGGWQQGNYAAGGSDIIVWLKGGGITYYWDCPDLQGGFRLASPNPFGDSDVGYGSGCVKDSSQLYNYQGRYPSSWCPITSQRGEVGPTKNRFYHYQGFAAPNLNISGSKNFKIDHPVDPDNTWLVHGSIEGPQLDLVYRGTATLSNGTATVIMDAEYDMLPGTWSALCRNPQAWITAKDDFMQCLGTVTDGVLTIRSQDETFSGEVSWLVIAERQDDSIKKDDFTDNEGRLIIEPSKATGDDVSSYRNVERLPVGEGVDQKLVEVEIIADQEGDENVMNAMGEYYLNTEGDVNPYEQSFDEENP